MRMLIECGRETERRVIGKAPFGEKVSVEPDRVMFFVEHPPQRLQLVRVQNVICQSQLSVC